MSIAAAPVATRASAVVAADATRAIVRALGPTRYVECWSSMRASSAGKYLSLTCTVQATSRDQLDNLYRELTSHPMVAMVL